MIGIYTVTVDNHDAIEVDTRWGKRKIGHFYILANSFEEAINKFAKRYPELYSKIERLGKVDHYNGIEPIQ